MEKLNWGRTVSILLLPTANKTAGEGNGNSTAVFAWECQDRSLVCYSLWDPKREVHHLATKHKIEYKDFRMVSHDFTKQNKA